MQNNNQQGRAGLYLSLFFLGMLAGYLLGGYLSPGVDPEPAPDQISQSYVDSLKAVNASLALENVELEKRLDTIQTYVANQSIRIQSINKSYNEKINEIRTLPSDDIITLLGKVPSEW